MPKKGHSEEQIITALKPYESGEKVADICRKLGVSQASFPPPISPWFDPRTRSG
jgi:transposase